MKSLPAGVDLSKLEIRETRGVDLSVIGEEYTANISQLRDAAEGKPAPPAKKKRPRYGRARKVELDGHTFDSQGEAKRYQRLRIEQAAGLITDLMVHPEYEMAVNGELVYVYTADFLYIRGGRVVCEDYKSEGTRRKDTWRLIKKLFHAIYGYRITEVGKGDV
jgi:hypothetical protein